MKNRKKSLMQAAIGLAIAGFVSVPAAVPAAAQETALFNGTSMDGWDRLGETNWRIEDGAIVADKKAAPAPVYIVSKNSYKDFVLTVEFWASDDANSGIYLRCADPAAITDRSCYEVNIFDKRGDPTYGTGAIVHFAEVDPMPKAGGKWNTFEITANGRQLTATLNGKKTAEVRNALFAEGPLTLQHGAGTIKFRKVAIKPLE